MLLEHCLTAVLSLINVFYGFSLTDSEQKIWVFTDDNLEKIYFYNRLLKKEHSFNKANLKTFR